MAGLREKSRSIAPAVLLLGALGLTASCKSAQSYLDPQGPVYSGSHAKPPSDDAPTAEGARRLRIVTFNIEYALRVDRALVALRDHPLLRGADLLTLQEMDAPGTAKIAEGLGLNYVYYPASVHPKYKRDVGNAILSPWPIESSFKLPLPHRSRVVGQSRLAAGALVQLPGGKVRVYTLHLGSPLGASPGQRREQLEVVLQHARDSPDPVVVAGDFNSKALGVRLVAAGYQWPTRDVGASTRGFSFDHVFVKGLSFEEARAGVARDVTDASDHRPVWVELGTAGAGLFDPELD